MSDRAILMSGIGGQGVQLAAKTLAFAAIAAGLEVMVFGTYGGSMRGGNTDVDMVVSSRPIRTPPVLDSAWAALVMHHENWVSVRAKLQRGGLALIDSSVFRADFGLDGVATVPVPASALAKDLGAEQAGSMVALGAFNALARLVPHEGLLSAAGEVLPPYRSQYIEANRRALGAGREAVADVALPGWAGAMESVL